MKLAFIAEQKVAFSIVSLCRVLEVSTSGHHAWRARPVAPRVRRDAELDVRVRAAYTASKGRYGSPRVHAELRASGDRVGRKRIARIMKRAGIAGRKRRRFQATTDSNHAFPIAPNVLKRDFTATSRRARQCPAGSTTQPRARSPLRSREHLRQRRLPPRPGCARDRVQHEPEGGLLGQCRRRELLRHHETRSGRDRPTGEPRPGVHDRGRLHRPILQCAATPLDDRLQEPCRVRINRVLTIESRVRNLSTRSGQPHPQDYEILLSSRRSAIS